MPDIELQRRIEQLRADYQVAVGSPFEHFFCPILHIDEPSEWCRGHIVPEAFSTCNAWVPQRKDIDNFYGTVAEADFISAVASQGKTAFDKWIDADLNRLVKPRLELEGKDIGHYFTKKPSQVPGQTAIQVTGQDGKLLNNLVIKKSSEELAALHGQTLHVVVEHDFRPAVIASVLKAAHLTMFRMLGYKHVFSPAGRYLAAILGEFYKVHGDKRGHDLKDALATYFRRYACMISCAMLDRSVLAGTVTDNRFLACIGATRGMFATGTFVDAGKDAFCVWLPAGDGIDTYLGFVNEPPVSVLAKILRFCPATEHGEASFTTSDEEPFRMELPSSLPTAGTGNRD